MAGFMSLSGLQVQDVERHQQKMHGDVEEPVSPGSDLLTVPLLRFDRIRTRLGSSLPADATRSHTGRDLDPAAERIKNTPKLKMSDAQALKSVLFVT